nr:hypothetical protein GCM10020093_042360 [Planobispora longispora]
MWAEYRIADSRVTASAGRETSASPPPRRRVKTVIAAVARATAVQVRPESLAPSRTSPRTGVITT